ncbi:zinc ribbon domain-containing protein [Candidatus Pacearchaeota archaeon]|jgi:putative FmdB family regulatory protein|nr:zinc ribbon domain-containing protein [Candidatus Pacearchaeota archaeon]
MPIYEYDCPKCHHKKEKLFRSNLDYAEGDPICPNCNIKMVKIISQNNFHLKGGGWTYRRKPTVEKG